MAQNTINVKAKGYSTANAYQFRITANDTGNISGSKREVECYLDSYATNPGGFYDYSQPRAYILIDGVQYQSAAVSKIWPRGQWVRLVTWKGYIESNKTITVTGRFNSNLESVNYMPVKGNNDVSVNLELNGVASKLNNTFSALTFDVEQPITLDITKYVESYTQNIRWVIYNETTQIETLFATFNNVENGSVIQLSQEQLNALYQNTTTIKMPALGMYLDTYDGETLIGSDRVPMVIRILNADPIFTDFDYADSNSITNSLTNSAQDIILGYSALKVTIPTSKKAVGQKYATMQSYIIDTVPINYSENEINLEIPNYNSNKIIVSAIDSRQKQTNVEKQLNIINYNPVEVNTTEVEIERTNGSDEETKISFSGTFWNGNFGKTTNSLTISYKYRLAGSTGDYSTGTTTITPTINESSFSVVDKAILGDTDSGFDISQSYEIVFEIKDKLEDLSKCEITCILSAGRNAIDIKGNKVLKINNIPFEEIISKGESILGEILFENETGVGTNITLAKNADNYSYLEIFYKDNDGVSNSTKVYSPNGKKVSLHITNLNNTGNATYIKSAQATINGTTITFVTNGFGFNGEVSFVSPSTVNTPKSNPKIYITRVVGYKLSASPTETQPKETDYVVESGSNSQWTWQKWNSGIAECWGNFTASGTNKVWVSPMYLLNKAYIGPINYPITFIETPIEVANVIYCKNACWLYKESDNANDNQVSTTHSGQYVPVKVNPFNNGTLSVTVSIHVKGKWK